MKKYLIIFSIILALSLIGYGCYLRFKPKPVIEAKKVWNESNQLAVCQYSEEDVLVKMNELRTNKLVMNKNLDNFAEVRLSDMPTAFNHTNFRARLDRGELPFGHYGEILATTQCGDTLIRAWLNSPTHKATMLNEQFDSVGIAGNNDFKVVIFGDLK